MSGSMNENITRHLMGVCDDQGIPAAISDATEIGGAAIGFLWGLAEKAPDHERAEIRAQIRHAFSKQLQRFSQ